MLIDHAAVFVRPVEVCIGIGLRRLQLKQVAAGGLSDITRYRLGIAGSGVVDYQRLSAHSPLLYPAAFPCGRCLR